MATSAFKPQPKLKKVVPTEERTDHHTTWGWMLLAVHQAPTPLERLIAVTRLLLELCCVSLLRGGHGLVDVPSRTLGCHHICRRSLGLASDGSQRLVKVQEIASYDPAESPFSAPREAQDTEVVSLTFRAQPVAKVKTRRFGRDAYVKVPLGAGQLRVCPATPAHPPGAGAASNPAPASAAGRPTPAGSGAPSPAQGSPAEEYAFTLPCLVLQDVLAPVCVPGLKGDLIVSCAATGCTAALTLGEDGSVRGQLEQLTRGPKGVMGRSAGGSTATVGTVSGSWRGSVSVECEAAGLSGSMGVGEGAGPKLMTGLDLGDPPALQRARLWTVVLDALIFNDPNQAKGKGALDVCRAVSQRAQGLPLAWRVASASARGGTTLTAAPSDTGERGEEEDDDEDALLMMPGAAERNRTATASLPAGGAKRVPPSVVAAHGKGMLTYQLVMHVVTSPHPLLASAPHVTTEPRTSDA